MRSNTGLRLFAGTVIVAAVLAALWVTGAFSSGGTATVATDTPIQIEVAPPELALTTPPSGSRQVGLRAGELAPDFEFSDYTGKRQKLSDYRGKAVFLNFWATWCGPCRVELPDMQAVLGEFPAGLAVIGVNNGERLDPGRAYLRDIKVDLTAAAYDPEAAIVRKYGLIGMPTTYLIDADGVITRSVNGQMSLDAMRVAVREAIAGYESIRD